MQPSLFASLSYTREYRRPVFFTALWLYDWLLYLSYCAVIYKGVDVTVPPRMQVKYRVCRRKVGVPVNGRDRGRCY